MTTPVPKNGPPRCSSSAWIAFGLFPLWHDLVVGAERGLVFFGFYALMPLVFVAFYVEDDRAL